MSKTEVTLPLHFLLFFLSFLNRRLTVLILSIRSYYVEAQSDLVISKCVWNEPEVKRSRWEKLCLFEH